jgi:outer membrane protein
MVFDKTAAPYARPDLDLTDMVVQMYNSGAGDEEDGSEPGDTPGAAEPAPTGEPKSAP